MNEPYIPILISFFLTEDGVSPIASNPLPITQRNHTQARLNPTNIAATTVGVRLSLQRQRRIEADLPLRREFYPWCARSCL